MKLLNITTAIGKSAMVLALCFATGSAFAGIASTKHNLGSTGTGPNHTTGTAEICVFCHTPHGADNSQSVPLWNKSLPASSTYTTYDSLGTSSLDGATAPVGSVSIACLSCHDGSQAMDSMINNPGSGNTSIGGVWTGSNKPTGIALLGTDLSDDHPVGIQYGGGGLTTAAPSGTMADSDFKAASNDTINTKPVWWVNTTGGTAAREKSDMQLYTRTLATVEQPFVECASCHDPHNSTNATFLRISNDGSAVCLACHTK